MQNLSDKVSSLKPNSILMLASKGEWSLHDLLPLLLDITGPAKISIASFSLSEEAVRGLLLLQEAGKILNLRCLFDYTMRSHKVYLMLFLEMVADDLRTTPNHAKIMLIDNDDWQVAVMGSANLTPNPRLELTAVFANRPEFDHIKETFESAWTDAIPYS